MAERSPRPILFANMAVLIGFGWLAILVGLTPVDARASALPSPDLLFCVAAFLAIRRPDATPAILVITLGLVRDLISGGPVGLGALTLWAGVEYLRFHRDRLLRSPMVEMGGVAATILSITVVQLGVLLLVLTPSPPLVVLGAGAFATLCAYGVVALVLRYLFRIRPESVENPKLIGRAARAR
ncbi:hypothetical protein G5B40_01865 [Pikeienuella piscinae]|uniref:Rod shape-determining protein MreD n=1 Tax=Pikeienuella piscinae TaxID=2748098 RepID=A0A7L5BXH7_9RHOB|nr:hypothetical protein [Pikeienuella piscinae]QIE54299.1 hypothetical protein G5B40_01865 [Pikeienuella piscinae]